jgi:hypothetical protein
MSNRLVSAVALFPASHFLSAPSDALRALGERV